LCLGRKTSDCFSERERLCFGASETSTEILKYEVLELNKSGKETKKESVKRKI
jgi:hypothetical protein